MKKKLSIILLLFLLVLGACSDSTAKEEESVSANTYPNKPIEMVVGFGEGGGTDTMARTIQPLLQQELGESVAVRNMPGASSALALEHVHEKEADGHTIFFQTDLIRVFPTMGMTDLTYKEFEQIGIGAIGLANFVVSKDSPLEDFSDLVELLKTKEAKVGVAGIGDPWHLTLEIVNSVVDGDAEIVTYESGSNAAMAALKGEVDFSISGVNEVVDLLRSGEARSLAVMDDEPFEVKDFGEIPSVLDTVTELNEYVPEGTWWGPAVKKGTPEEVIDQLKEAYQTIIATEEFKTFAENNAIVLVDIEDPQQHVQDATEKTSWILYDIGVGERSPEEVGIPRP